MLRTASNILTKTVGRLRSSSGKTSLSSVYRTVAVNGSFDKTGSRQLHKCPQLQNNFPPSGNDFARPGGIASFMRLPVQKTSDGLDACFVGVPLDIGCSNRPGPRFGPRQIRIESPMVRAYQQVTGADPFSSLMVADIGDVFLNFYNLPEAVKQIADQYREIIKNGCIPLTLGGDHTISYPILQAIKEKHGSVALVHIDAHTDVSDVVLGAKISHGTVFRRSLEEDLIDPTVSYQIGLRGTSHTLTDYDWSRKQGFRVVLAQDLWYKSAAPLMEEVRSRIGDRPTYISFDIDGIDPCYCPGTGAPEIGGLTTTQALEIVQGCRGLNVVGGDMVEVSPPFDPAGVTSLTAANLLFEMLCILPGVKYKS